MKKKIVKYVLAASMMLSPLLGDEGFSLQVNEKERETISEIISEMSERSLVMLFFHQGHMNHLGDSVRHVPPLQFLGCILVDEYLRGCLKKISSHAIKWSYFIDGFGQNMEKEFSKGRIFHDLPGFASLVERDYEKLLHLSLQHEWGSFVRESL